MLKQNAFSLVEVIVASVIFTVSVAGIFGAVRSVANRSTTQLSKDVRAVAFGQKFLEGLRTDVAANRWSDRLSPLAVGTHLIPQDADFSDLSGNYIVEDLGGVRRVTLNIITP